MGRRGCQGACERPLPLPVAAVALWRDVHASLWPVRLCAACLWHGNNMGASFVPRELMISWHGPSLSAGMPPQVCDVGPVARVVFVGWRKQ